MVAGVGDIDPSGWSNGNAKRPPQQRILELADAKEERITVVVPEHLDPVVILISNQHAVRRRFDRPGPVELAVRSTCSTGTDRTQRRAVGGEHIDPVMALVRNEYVTRRVDRHTNRPLKSGDHVGPA